MAYQAKLVEAGHATTDLHRQGEQLRGPPSAFDFNFGSRLAAERASIILSDQVEEPGEPLIKGNIHIQNDVLDALKTSNGLVGKL